MNSATVLSLSVCWTPWNDGSYTCICTLILSDIVRHYTDSVWCCNNMWHLMTMWDDDMSMCHRLTVFDIVQWCHCVCVSVSVVDVLVTRLSVWRVWSHCDSVRVTPVSVGVLWQCVTLWHCVMMSLCVCFSVCHGCTSYSAVCLESGLIVTQSVSHRCPLVSCDNVWHCDIV